MARRRLIKLVRDQVSQYRVGDSKIRFEQLPSHQAHAEELRKKLLEEVGEYLVDPSKGELADVLQVVKDLAYHDLCCGYLDVVAECRRKCRERGGFEEGIGMYVETTAEHG